MTLALGLMSGTSCDGVSAALVNVERRTFRLLAYRTFPYPARIARTLHHARELRTPQLAQLNIQLGELFAHTALRLMRSARVSPSRVAVIGSHGHTVYHGPPSFALRASKRRPLRSLGEVGPRDATPCTLQLGEPAIIAHRTGVPVVADFRMRDLAAGGQGAPLIPFFDHYFFGGGQARALQNIGGIANVTLVGRGITTTACDTGPGNCVIDAAMRRLTHGRHSCDHGGRLAANGRIDSRALTRLLAHPFLRQAPPKSTGPEQFDERLIERVFGRPQLRSGRGADVLATLTAFTAMTIADSYRRFLPAMPHEVIVSGGGCFNRTLMRDLSQQLAPIPVRTIAEHGMHPQAKEPVAFAFLGLRALRGQINHLPSTTGASRACVLGTLTRP